MLTRNRIAKLDYFFNFASKNINFIEKNGGILIDYKSDRIYDEEELKARYCIQLELYRTALERAMGISIRETYLYSFAMGKAIPLT